MAAKPAVWPRQQPGRRLGSVLWVLSPLLSLGFLTPVAFAIAWLRRRTLAAFIPFVIYSAVLTWSYVTNRSGMPQNDLSLNAQLAVGWVLGTVHAFGVRRSVWYLGPPDSGGPAPGVAPEGERPERPAEEPENPVGPEPEATAADAGALPEAAPVETPLGRLVCDSEAYRANLLGLQAFADAAVVTAIIDAAEAAGGVLTAAEVGRIAGRPTDSVAAYTIQLQRVLNIDGAPVLSKRDGGVELDLELLRRRFLDTAT